MQGENDARPLEAGKPIERELAGGQNHYYKITLEASAGRYEVKIANLRMATSQDRNRVLAERAFAEGTALQLQGKAESLRRAIAKLEEALGLFRVTGDRQGEGATLDRLGYIYNLLGDSKKALDYFNNMSSTIGRYC